MTDAELIDGIKAGGYTMERVIEKFYRANFNFVHELMSRYKLEKEEALDAYSDAVTQFNHNVYHDRYRNEAKCTTYFFRIFQNKCVDIIRKKTTNVSEQTSLSIHLEDQTIADTLGAEENAHYLRTLLAHLSDGCRSILLDWNDGYSMEEIAERNNLLNAHTARSKRYTCFKQLMEFVKKDKKEITH